MSRFGSCLLRGIHLTRRLRARTQSTARAFGTDRGGNVTLIFALAIIPIFGAVAAAVDYSRGNSARTAMQAVLDATTPIMAASRRACRSPPTGPRSSRGSTP